MMATYGADPRKWKANGCCNDEAAIQETVRHSINMRKLDEMDAEIVNNLHVKSHLIKLQDCFKKS